MRDRLRERGVHLVTVESLAKALRVHDRNYAADWRAGDRAWTWERQATAILAVHEAEA